MEHGVVSGDDLGLQFYHDGDCLPADGESGDRDPDGDVPDFHDFVCVQGGAAADVYWLGADCVVLCVFTDSGVVVIGVYHVCADRRQYAVISEFVYRELFPKNVSNKYNKECNED